MVEMFCCLWIRILGFSLKQIPFPIGCHVIGNIQGLGKSSLKLSIRPHLYYLSSYTSTTWVPAPFTTWVPAPLIEY